MAKKFSITQAPTFVGNVPVPRIGGEAVDVPFTFKYRDREQLAQVFELWRKRRMELFESIGAETSGEEVARREIAFEVEQLRDVVVGWGFDEPFDDQHIEALVRSLASVPEAVVSAYAKAFHQARLGN